MRTGRLISAAVFLVATVVCIGCAKRPQGILNADAVIPAQMVHFGFDSARIGSDEEAQIEKNASWMMENNAYLILTGHCDRVGPKDYNLWLGDRRARAVKARMIMNGVPEDRILPVISYGKSRPIDKRPGVKAMAMNRRVEFVVR